MKIKNLLQIALAGLIVFFAFRYVIFAQSNSTTTIDSMMTEEELKRTGVYKLSPSEKIELKSWIDRNCATPKDPQEPPQPQRQSRYTSSYQQLPVISEVTSDGNFIKLDDGTNWQIYPADTPISSGWLIPVPMKVEYTGNGEYPYTLTNTVTESKVSARKITYIPENTMGYLKNIWQNFKKKGVVLNIIIYTHLK